MSSKETPLTYFEVIKKLSNAQALLLSDVGQNPAKRQLAVLDKTLSYLNNTPAKDQDAKSCMEMLTALSLYNLTNTEKVTILNLRPVTSIDAQVIIEEAVDRFDETDIERIATLSKNILPNSDS
uniref:DNA-directed RNA polymerase III subunit RPC9 n=1 Tax=Strongyloides stercoralis TaxID=6248 RepID=A0A0K0EJG6_STRER